VLENKFEEEPSLLIKIENILMECNKLSETELEIEKQSERKIAIEYDQQTFDVINININGTIVNVQGNNHIVQQTDNETTSNLKRKFSQSEMPIKIKGIEVATSTTKKPILEYLIGKGGYGEVYRGK
jgi:chaperone required for assembly of F1-ATPase